MLRRIQELTSEGMNLAGVMRIMELELEIGSLREDLAQAMTQLEAMRDRLEEFTSERERMALVPFKDVRRVRRAMKSDVLERAGRRRTFPSPPVDLANRHRYGGRTSRNDARDRIDRG